MYEVWFNYIQPKYQENAKLCYIDTDSFIIYIKSEDVYEDIADNVEKKFDTSDYKVNRPLSKGKNEKVIRLIKDELGGKIMIKLDALRPKTYSCTMDDGINDKKAKEIKNVQ